MLDYNDINANQKISYNSKLDKNSTNKYQKGNVLKESGANIISGMNDLNNKLKEKEKNSNEDGELNYDNLDELDIDINEVGNNSKTNKNTNSKISKLNKVTNPYERLELLNQYELDNKKETQKLLDDIVKSQNSNIDDI